MDQNENAAADSPADDSPQAKGGVARALALTKTEKTSIARKAAQARWAGGIPSATHGSPDHPLRIGDGETFIEIPCYVLEDGRRVLAMNGVLSGLNMSRGGSGGSGAQGDRLTAFLTSKSIKPFVQPELLSRITNPIRFRATHGGSLASGYEATILADLCDAVLECRRSNALNRQQQHIADRCEILVRGFSRVGIIALVDEATGYQQDRARDALATILEKFIAAELQPWIRTFPVDFYEQMFRLRGLPFSVTSVSRPRYFGLLTNDLVYKRLAPGVLEELKRVTPKAESGRRKHKYFQKLTSNIGYPKLREHLGSVVTIMKLSDKWEDFMHKMDRLHPRYGDTMMLPFDYDDDGKGL